MNTQAISNKTMNAFNAALKMQIIDSAELDRLTKKYGEDHEGIMIEISDSAFIHLNRDRSKHIQWRKIFDAWIAEE